MTDSERLTGRFEALPMAYREDATIDLGSLDINGWLDCFSDKVNQAQEIAREEVDFVLAKTRFYEAYGDQLNDRQARMVSRVFAEGRKGFEGGITTRTYEAITRCPSRTASRDLSDLVAKELSSRYRVAVERPVMS